MDDKEFRESILYFIVIQAIAWGLYWLLGKVR